MIVGISELAVVGAVVGDNISVRFWKTKARDKR